MGDRAGWFMSSDVGVRARSRDVLGVSRSEYELLFRLAGGK